MKRNTTLALACALWLAAGAACSRRHAPDPRFNGAWQLDLSQSQGVPPMMQGHSTVIKLTASGEAFTIAFVFDGNPMNVSKFTLDGQSHPLPLGGVTGAAVARVLAGGRAIALDIHRPAGTSAAADEHIVFTLAPDGQTIRRERTVPGRNEPPQVYLYRRLSSN